MFQEPPTFLPIVPRYHLHTAYNTLPSKIRFQHTVEHFEINRLFLTQSLLEDMVAKTNAYAAAKAREWQLEGGRKWKEVSASELGVWLGIVLYMGVYSSPAVKDYRRHDGLNSTHPICEYMGQTQFEEIKRYLHVSSPDLSKIAPTGKRLCTVRWMLFWSNFENVHSHITCLQHIFPWMNVWWELLGGPLPHTRCQPSPSNKDLSFAALLITVTSGISIQPQTKLALILFHQPMAWLQQEKFYTISYESSLVLHTGQSFWITFISEFHRLEDCIMICIWDPVEQHVIPQLIFHQNSKFQTTILGNMSTMPWKHLPLRTACLASWLVHICGSIIHQLQFSVQYMNFNFSRRG